MINPGEIPADTKAKYGTAVYWKDQYMNVLKHYTDTAERLDKITAEQAKNVTRRANDIVHEWVAPIPHAKKLHLQNLIFIQLIGGGKSMCGLIQRFV